MTKTSMNTNTPVSLDKGPMRLVRRQINDAAIGVGVAETAEGLSAIHRPGCAAAIWRRNVPPTFQAWIDALDPETMPNGRVAVPARSVGKAVRTLCDESGLAKSTMRDHLVQDIDALSAHFAKLMDAAFIKLRLETVTSNACSKFHIDSLTARLICTYRGTGTQYGILTEGDAPRRVFTVPTGSPMILRGTLWPQSPPAGVMHRSPPIEGTGETRLVLVLDPATKLD